MVKKTKSVGLKSPEKMVAGKKLVVQVKAPLTNISERKSNMPAIASLPASPNSSAWNVEDNLVSLRIQNKQLTDAVQAVLAECEKQIRHKFDLVWFVRNRMRYPTHEASIRIEESQVYKEDLDLLRGPNGDYHHGVHAAMLAASRMFKDHVDVVDRIGNDGEDEVKKLPKQNKLMNDALKSLVIEANRQTERASAIMWFARNRLRHPTHEKTKLIENSVEFKDDLDKIRGPQGEYHFGFNMGILEAARIFKEHANVPFLDVDEVEVAEDIQKILLASKEAFPRTETDSFPQLISD